jgi:hypothetical protein
MKLVTQPHQKESDSEEEGGDGGEGARGLVQFWRILAGWGLEGHPL